MADGAMKFLGFVPDEIEAKRRYRRDLGGDEPAVTGRDLATGRLRLEEKGYGQAFATVERR